MREFDVGPWQHDHSFGQADKRPGEARTTIVIGVTAVTMIVEIVAGIAFGSMALLADGLHMASHATALSIALFAYVYARRHADDERFSFGTGKVNSLAGFVGAILLAMFALAMVWESVGRLVLPVEIAFNQAIVVAVVGLAVNGVCMSILGHQDHHHEDHHHEDRHHEDHEEASEEAQADRVGHDSHAAADHNLRAAYLHVLADTLTSLLAIFALLAAKYLGLVWMDPLMGIVGAVLVGRWSLGLLSVTGSVLLDHGAPEPVESAVRGAIEREGRSHVADLHIWPIGPGIYAAIISIVSADPQEPVYYKRLLPSDLNLAHVSIEVHRTAAVPSENGGDL